VHHTTPHPIVPTGTALAPFLGNKAETSLGAILLVKYHPNI
jgi:hypothetical protein